MRVMEIIDIEILPIAEAAAAAAEAIEELTPAMAGLQYNRVRKAVLIHIVNRKLGC